MQTEARLSEASSTQPMRLTVLPDALRDALGQVIADQRREWRRERELMEAQARAAEAQAREVAAECRARIVEFERRVEEAVTARLAEVRDGRDGAEGPVGPPGRDGTDAVGERGAEGPPGRDGLDAYPGTVCGLYDPAAEYRALDIVTLGDTEWRAVYDNPGPLPGDGWRRGAGKGKPGQKGERGERGDPGPAGRDGAVLVGGRFDERDMRLILTRSDGETFEVDAYDFANAIRGMA
jgi:hypothetical protein